MSEPVDAYAAILEALDRNHAIQLENQKLQMDLRSKIEKHVDEEAKTITNAVKEGIESVSEAAFPKGDPIHHREWHERSIEAKRKFRASVVNLVFEVAKWAVIAVVGWLVMLVWQGVLKGPAS